MPTQEHKNLIKKAIRYKLLEYNKAQLVIYGAEPEVDKQFNQLLEISASENEFFSVEQDVEDFVMAYELAEDNQAKIVAAINEIINASADNTDLDTASTALLQAKI